MLIFLHGVISNHTSWKKVYQELEKLNYGTLAIDLRGHGKSENKNVKIKNMVKDFELILKKEKIKDYIIIGNSLGANIALQHSEIYKRKTKCFLINPLSQDTKGSLALYYFAKFVKFISYFIPGENIFYDLENEWKKPRVYHYLNGFDFRKKSLKNYSNLVLELYHSNYKNNFLKESLFVFCIKDQGLISKEKFLKKNKNVLVLNKEHIILSRNPQLVLKLIREFLKC